MSDERITRVEENLAFVEQANSETLTQLLDLDKRLRALTARIARIESRLMTLDAGADQPPEGDDAPSDA